MKRIEIAVLMLLGMCGIGKAQPCTATLAASGHSESDIFTGTSVTQGSYSLAGIGIEEASGFSVGIHNSASVAIPAGDFTWQGEVNTLSGGTAPRASFELVSKMTTGTIVYDRFNLYVINSGGSLTVYFDEGRKSGTFVYYWTHLGSQSVSGLNLSLKLVRSGNNLTASVATDNVNYLTVGTFAGTQAPIGTVALVTDSGDYTTVASATYSNVLLNGAVPTLTPNATYGGGFSSGVVSQAGTINTATSLSGSITVSNCPSGAYANAASTVTLVQNPNTNPVGIFSFLVTGPNNTCTSTCSFSAANPVTGVHGPYNLFHGTPYAFNSSVTVTVFDSSGIALFGLNVPTVTIPLNP